MFGEINNFNLALRPAFVGRQVKHRIVTNIILKIAYDKLYVRNTRWGFSMYAPPPTFYKENNKLWGI